MATNKKILLLDDANDADKNFNLILFFYLPPLDNVTLV